MKSYPSYSVVYKFSNLYINFYYPNFGSILILITILELLTGPVNSKVSTKFCFRGLDLIKKLLFYKFMKKRSFFSCSVVFCVVLSCSVLLCLYSVKFCLVLCRVLPSSVLKITKCHIRTVVS